jgi:hypothetical protein
VRKSAIILWTILIVATVGVIWLGNLFGQWYFTFLVAVMIGLWGKPGFSTWLGAWVTGTLGWGLPLFIQSASAPIGRTSHVIAGILGVQMLPWLGLALTLFLGFLMATVGVWLGTVLRKWRISATE